MNLETIASPHTQESTEFFQNLLIFNWRIIALQCCVGFCHTSTRISHRYTYVPSLLNLPPLSHLSHPSRLSQSTRLSSLCNTANSYWLSVLHMVMFTLPSHSLNSSHPLLPPLCPQVYSLSASSLLPCKYVHQHHLSRFHIYVLIYNICLSLSDLLHSLQQALASSTSLGLTQMC